MNEQIVEFNSPHPSELAKVNQGYAQNPAESLSLHADAYTKERWFAHEQETVFKRSWQFVCHEEKLKAAGDYLAMVVAGQSVVVLRNKEGLLQAFYNVCKHRAHELLQGEGQVNQIMCPYHCWVYDLNGQLTRTRHTENLKEFNIDEICLDSIQVENFCGLVFVNLDVDADALVTQSGELKKEMDFWAPDLKSLTHAHRLTYDIKSNWKNVVDNFLECYHCPIAHKDFCTLVDMDSYRVTTHGIYSSHMAEAGKSTNSAYSVDDATVKDHAVWWLWPNTCLLRYPGRGNFMVLNVIPVGPDRTLETYDLFLETAEPNESELETIRYLDEVLQAEDIALVESVQRGMSTPAFTQGRIVHDPDGSGMSEHAVHHFHGLVLDAYNRGSET